MRILIAGLIGGLVMFMWGAVSHMMLPIGEMGMKTPTEQASALATLGPSTQGSGVYMYPSPPKEDWNDEAKMKAFAESAKGQPYAFVIYQPGGNPVNQSMTPALVKQWGSDTLAAILAAMGAVLIAWAATTTEAYLGFVVMGLGASVTTRGAGEWTEQFGLNFNQTIYSGGSLSSVLRQSMANRDASFAGLKQRGVDVAEDVGGGDDRVDQAVGVDLARRGHEHDVAGLGEEEVEVSAADVARGLEQARHALGPRRVEHFHAAAVRGHRLDTYARRALRIGQGDGGPRGRRVGVAQRLAIDGDGVLAAGRRARARRAGAGGKHLARGQLQRVLPQRVA